MGSITVVGTGLARGQLTLEGAEVLRSAVRVILHTQRCEAARWLSENGIPFSSLDDLYDSAQDFDVHAEMAARAVMDAAAGGDVAYAVFDVRDRSVRALTRLWDGEFRAIPGPPSEGALLALTTGDVELVEASDWENFRISARRDTLVREMATRQLAGEVKLKLMEVYPQEMNVWLLLGGRPVKLPLPEVDRLKGYDHTTALLAPAWREIPTLEKYDFGNLMDIMALLRAPGGCPWDRAQTHESLKSNLAEEAYEAIDAIDRGDTDALYDELGDILMQVALHAQIGREYGEFDISDVTTAICRKMISRHVHVFGKEKADTPDEVLGLWQEQKRKERGYATRGEALTGVTKGLPALMRAAKLLSRASDANVGDSESAASERLMRAASLAAERPDDERIGRLLLAAVNLARQCGVDAESALRDAGNRFAREFCQVERELAAQGIKIEDASAEVVEAAWRNVKLSDG